MWWDYVKKALQFFSTLNKDTRALIVLLVLILLNVNISNLGIVERVLEREKLEKLEAERYTEKMTPTINNQVQYILLSDPRATNVILLSYHNNNHSSQGFSYRYITYMTEKTRDIENELHEEEFRELNYVHYGEELAKIHNRGYLRVDSIPMLKNSFPKLYRKFAKLNYNSVAFVPLEGVVRPAGLVIILYKDYITSNSAQCKDFSKYTQRLTTILDYNTFKNQLEDYENW